MVRILGERTAKSVDCLFGLRVRKSWVLLPRYTVDEIIYKGKKSLFTHRTKLLINSDKNTMAAQMRHHNNRGGATPNEQTSTLIGIVQSFALLPLPQKNKSSSLATTPL